MRLKRINLKKGEGHFHPDINTKSQYLAKIGGRYFAGTFSKQWFGFHFSGWYGVGIQYDKPGTNSSSWEALYRITK